jgi:hypothetical protein
VSARPSPWTSIVVMMMLAACGAGAGASGRVAYVIRAHGDSADARQQLHDALVRAIGAPADDVSGDGFVVRLDDGARARIAALAEVGAIVPLAPAARLGAIGAASATTGATTAGSAGATIVRVDLFDDASADEGAAVAAWIAAHGGSVVTRAPTALVARLDRSSAIAAASLPAVRWVEEVVDGPRR